MKVLMLCPYVPVPTQGGGGTCDYYYVKNLHRNHQIDLLCLARQADPAGLDMLRGYCRRLEVWPVSRATALFNVFGALFNGRSFRLAYFSSTGFRRRVSQLMTEEGYDVVLATHERMGQYALNSTRARRVLDLHDVVSRRHQMLARSARNPVMRLVHNWEARRVASYERASLDEFDAVWVTTPTEAEQLRAHDRNHRLRATLRGIDLDDFPYTWRGSDSRAMVFSGHMSYEPNVDSVLYFLKEIYASVRQAVPEASLQVVGNYPHARVVRAARRAPAVEVTGRVPSVVNHLARGRVFVVPMRVGTGVRVKLLEAMAVGVPVVTTAVGCDGLGVKHEEQVLVADRPEDFAREISRLFADSQLAEALSRNGRRFVEQHYDLEKTAAEVELLLTQLVAE